MELLNVKKYKSFPFYVIIVLSLSDKSRQKTNETLLHNSDNAT